MTRRTLSPLGLLQKGLLIVLLGYALAIQLFAGAYLQLKMAVAAFEGRAVICSSLASLVPGEHPVHDEGNAHCLALCQLACGSGPVLVAFLRDLPPYQPASEPIRFAAGASHVALSVLYDTPQARGPPSISLTL